jgi:hypothetical protein
MTTTLISSDDLKGKDAMRRITVTLAAWLLAGVGGIEPIQAQTDEPGAEEAKEGFVSLFNGKDLTGWRFGEMTPTPETLPPNWKVEDGVIKLSGGNSPHLASQREFADFDVRFQWRAMRDRYNSGFFIRSGRDVKANQINLSQSAVGKLMSGAEGGDAVPTLQKPVGEWNDWRVVAVGDCVTFWCNGQRAWEVRGFKDRRGYLGLQAEGAPMEFRRIRIKELSSGDVGTEKE